MRVQSKYTECIQWRTPSQEKKQKNQFRKSRKDEKSVLLWAVFQSFVDLNIEAFNLSKIFSRSSKLGTLLFFIYSHIKNKGAILHTSAFNLPPGLTPQAVRISTTRWGITQSNPKRWKNEKSQLHQNKAADCRWFPYSKH